METLCEDILARCGDEPTCLVGSRFGANLAWKVCGQMGGIVRRVVLVEPIADGGHYVEYLRRKQRVKDMMTGGGIGGQVGEFENLEGYMTSKVLLGQMAEFDMCEVKESVERVGLVYVNAGGGCAAGRDVFRGAAERAAKFFEYAEVDGPMFWERVWDRGYGELIEKVVGLSVGE